MVNMSSYRGKLPSDIPSIPKTEIGFNYHAIPDVVALTPNDLYATGEDTKVVYFLRFGETFPCLTKD